MADKNKKPKPKTLSKYGKPVGRPPISDEERERRAKEKEAKRTIQLPNVELVPQAHGGALRRGNPGNKGRPSASPADLRAAMRGSLRDRLHLLNKFADDEDLPVDTRMKAMDLMFKFGLGKHDEVTNKHENAPLVIRQVDKIEINVQREQNEQRVEAAYEQGLLRSGDDSEEAEYEVLSDDQDEQQDEEGNEESNEDYGEEL